MSSPPTPPLLLASTSPQRRAILEQLGVPFDVVAPKLYAAFVAAGINDAIRVRTAHVPGLTPALAA